MDRRAKFLLSIIGVGAVVVPAVLLIFLSSNAKKEPQIKQGSRQLDTSTIEGVVKNVPQNPPEFSLPSPATNSAYESPVQTPEGSPSAQ